MPALPDGLGKYEFQQIFLKDVVLAWKAIP